MLGLGAMAGVFDGMFSKSDHERNLPEAPRRPWEEPDWALYAPYEWRSLDQIAPPEKSDASTGQEGAAVGTASESQGEAPMRADRQSAPVDAGLSTDIRTITNAAGRTYVDVPAGLPFLFIPSSQVADVFSYPSISQVTASYQSGTSSPSGASTLNHLAPRDHGAIRPLTFGPPARQGGADGPMMSTMSSGGSGNNAPVAYDDLGYWDHGAASGALVWAGGGAQVPIFFEPGSGEEEIEDYNILDNDEDEDDDPFWVDGVDTYPQHGTLSGPASDGYFTYEPDPGYTGQDYFLYTITDGTDVSDPATVYIEVVEPWVDLDVDSDNNGTIDGTPYEDGQEMVDPGKILRQNIDDDNTNGVADRMEAPLQDAAGQPVDDDDLCPAELSWGPTGTAMTGCVLELSRTANLRLWKTRDKQTLPMSYTIGTDAVPSEIYVEGYDLGQGTVTATLKDPSGVTLDSDVVKLTVVLPNLTGYRPQTEGPGYGSPFPRTAVPWQNETDPGVGIRFNGDDDDADGTADYDPNDTSIAGENDLIEVDVDFAADAGVQYRLRASNQNIKAWANSTKSGEYHLDGNYVLTSAPTIWVESVQSQAADLELLVYDGTHGNLVFVGDRLHFYPFTSVLIAYGGWDQVPLGAGAGPFLMAQSLYERGYDVHAYNERTLKADNPTEAHREVISAVDERGVQQVALFGYSYGGGGVYELLTRLGATPPQGNFTVPFTAYIDGIIWDSIGGAEENLPPGTQYHVNYWQSYQGDWYDLNGEPVQGAKFNLDVRTTAWGAALDHYTIDNDLTVRTRILDGSTAGGTEGPHAGLTQRVTR